MAGDPIRQRRTRTEELVRNFQENGIQWLLENPGNVRDLLGLTGESRVAEIDLERMHLVRSTFVNRDYRRRASDVVLVAPFRKGRPERRLMITILIEHQSEELLSYLYAFVYHEREECERQPLLDRIEAAEWKSEHRQELNQMGKTIAEALRDEGRAEERVESARSTLLRQLRRKFGDISQDMAERIEGTTDLERLTTWLDRIVTVETLEEMGIGLEKA
jgi:putative YhgA-like transposase